MESEKNHITEYIVYIKTWAILLVLTAINLTIATVSHGKLIAGIIVLVSVIQAVVALNWYMHLRWDNRLFRVLVIGVFLMYAVILIITFLDYKFR
jgi:cytochrome c oxidase subunit 4